MLCCWLAFCCSPTRACSVPVFRYALERWTADLYRVVVFHRGPLSPEDQALVDLLEKYASGYECNANLEVRTVDVESRSEGSTDGLRIAPPGAQLPWMVLLFPDLLRPPQDAWPSADTTRGPQWTAPPPESEQVWAGAFNSDNVRALLHSPKRREIARLILDGQAAVWVLLECGNQEEDNAAAELLETELNKIERLVELPGPMADAGDDVFYTDDWLPVPVSFSTVRLSRSDPAEQAFVNMLIGSEPDLKEYSEPMAFPVFGRGRVLWALVGKGVNERNIEETCAFLAGWCSCQVKALNPGTDLLMAADWDAALRGAYMTDEALPPLTGVFSAPAAQETAAAPAQAPVPAAAIPEGPAPGASVARNVVIALGAVTFLLVAATFILRRGSGTEGK